MEVMRFDCRRDTYHSMPPMPRQNKIISTRIVRSWRRRMHPAKVCATTWRTVFRLQESLVGFISSLRGDAKSHLACHGQTLTLPASSSQGILGLRSASSAVSLLSRVRRLCFRPAPVEGAASVQVLLRREYQGCCTLS